MASLIFVRSFRINAFVWQEREDISKNEEVAPQSENNPQYVKSRSSADCEQSESFILKSEPIRSIHVQIFTNQWSRAGLL